jgi:predicted transcriptional regulator YdeE
MDLADRQSLTVTGFLAIAPWEDLPIVVPAAWRKLFSRVGEIGGTAASPEYVEISFERERGIFRELVGVVTPAGTPIPEGMQQVLVPAGRYLHVVHQGELTGIADSFQALYDHAAAAGIDVTDFKLDFGYDPLFSPGQHDLFVGLASTDRPQLIGPRPVR